MARRISDKTKEKRGMGTGTGADYKPYILVREFNSLGTAATIRDWKTGRVVQLASQGEVIWFFILRWDDNTADICEQFKLPNKETVKIAERYGIRHPGGKNHVMTTDLLVTERSGRLHAYSVKADRDLKSSEIRSVFIEKIYWTMQDVPFTLLYKSDADEILADNIRLVTKFYDDVPGLGFYDKIKHKIATKQYAVDMSEKILDAEALLETFRKNHNKEDY